MTRSSRRPVVRSDVVEEPQASSQEARRRTCLVDWVITCDERPSAWSWTRKRATAAARRIAGLELGWVATSATVAMDAPGRARVEGRSRCISPRYPICSTTCAPTGAKAMQLSLRVSTRWDVDRSPARPPLHFIVTARHLRIGRRKQSNGGRGRWPRLPERTAVAKLDLDESKRSMSPAHAGPTRTES
jgi:hypothetical protein